MTSDKQRIAIAQACGWTGIRGEIGYPTARACELGDYQRLPDYLNDLNAMHEAENCCITNAKLEESYYFAIDRNHRATAAQRAEAFLRTLNLYTP